MEKNSVCTAADLSEIAFGGRHSTPRFGSIFKAHIVYLALLSSSIVDEVKSNVTVVGSGC